MEFLQGNLLNNMNIPTKTTVTCEFCMKGEEFDVEYVTNQLKIIPSRTWNKGDIRKGIYKYQCTNWEYITESEESSDINMQLLKIVDVFHEKEEILCMLKEDFSLYYYIEIVIEIVNNETPRMCFDDNFIKFAANIGAIIDVDTYIY